jgi:hypothetical protein
MKLPAFVFRPLRKPNAPTRCRFTVAVAASVSEPTRLTGDSYHGCPQKLGATVHWSAWGERTLSRKRKWKVGRITDHSRFGGSVHGLI